VGQQPQRGRGACASFPVTPAQARYGRGDPGLSGLGHPDAGGGSSGPYDPGATGVARVAAPATPERAASESTVAAATPARA